MTRSSRLRANARGIFVILPTPCNEKFEIDYKRYRDHIKWLIDQGLVNAKAVLLGAVGGGECVFLTEEEHVNIMKALVDAANGRVPTCTGVFLSNTREAVTRAKMAADIGIDLVLANPPHNLRPSDEEVYTHYRTINDQAEIGILAYNTPWSAAGYELRPPILSRLVELDNVFGLKWMSLDTDNYMCVLEDFSKKCVIVDNSYHTSTAFRLGARGFISSLANIAPKLELDFLDLLDKKDYANCDDGLHTWFWEFGRLKETETTGEGTVVKAIFEAAGLPMGPPFPPQRRATKSEVQKLRKVMEDSGVMKHVSVRHAVA